MQQDLVNIYFRNICVVLKYDRVLLLQIQVQIAVRDRKVSKMIRLTNYASDRLQTKEYMVSR